MAYAERLMHLTASPVDRVAFMVSVQPASQQLVGSFTLWRPYSHEAEPLSGPPHVSAVSRSGLWVRP